MAGISIPGLTVNSNAGGLKPGSSISFGVQPVSGPAKFGTPLPITSSTKAASVAPSGGRSSSPAPVAAAPSNPGPSAEQQQQNQIRGEIGSGFDSYISSLDSQLSLLPEHYQALSDNINGLYSGQKSSIDTERTNDNADLDNDTKQVQGNQVSTLRTLSQSLQDALDAGNAKLGSMGASDSSAAPMYAYALSLQDNKNRGNVLAQANTLYSNINLKKTQVNATLDDQVNQLDTWKSTQLSSLAQWLDDQKSKIASAKGGAQLQKSQALASLDQSALGRLQQLDDQYTQYQQALSSWATGHQQQLDTALQNLSQTAQMSIPNLTSQGVDGSINPTSAGGDASSSDIFGLLGNGQKVDQFGNPISS